MYGVPRSSHPPPFVHRREVLLSPGIPGLGKTLIWLSAFMIRLPDFLDTRCVYFQACGRLLRRAQASDDTLVSMRSMKAGRAYLRFFAGGPKKNHLHLDIALAKLFPPDRKPPTNAKTPEILAQLGRHKGQDLELLLLGRYIIDITEANDSGLLFVGPRAVVSTVNDATATVAGASLMISDDANVDYIRWELFEAEALIDIYGRCKLRVSDDYLVTAFDLMQAAFTTYILGEAKQ